MKWLSIEDAKPRSERETAVRFFCLFLGIGLIAVAFVGAK